MGYNISEVSGTFSSASTLDNWTFDADLTDPSVTTVSGDFDVVPILGGGASGEADDYAFGPLSSTAWGSLSFDTSTGEFTFTIDRAAVIASGSDQTVTFLVTGTSGGDLDEDTVIINILICVARGTMIATPEGDVPVETLDPGDPVLTADGRTETVRWIGARRIGSDELRRDPALRPIRIGPSALGPGRPTRELRVSPQHRIALDDWRSELFFGAPSVLAPAKGLLNDGSITVDRDCVEVEYFHILFDRHEIILTEGLPTESFFPGSYALSELDGAVLDELLTLFPELRSGTAGMAAARRGVRPWEARLLSGGGRK